MDDLENKLESLDKLFDEAHSISGDVITKEEQPDDEVCIEMNSKNHIGTLKNKYKFKIVPQEDVMNDNIDKPINDEVKELNEHVDNVINDSKNDEIVVNEENTKLIELPNELLPAVQKEQEYPLMVQKEQTRALTKVGSVVTSILVTLVTLTIGVILAFILR